VIIHQLIFNVLSNAALGKLCLSLLSYRGVNGYHDYIIITKLKKTGENIEVSHRYSAFEDLHKLLCLEKPGCIVPPIPEKSSAYKLFHVDSIEI
jgi:hypothetical protein